MKGVPPIFDLTRKSFSALPYSLFVRYLLFKLQYVKELFLVHLHSSFVQSKYT